MFQSVFTTVLNDVARITSSFNQTLLHGEPTNVPKTLGQTAQSQWFHVFLSAVNSWCESNPSAKVPASFLPSENEEIQGLMTGQPAKSESDVAVEGSN